MHPVRNASGDSASKRVHSEVIDLEEEAESDRDGKKRRVESAPIEDSTKMVPESEAVVGDIEMEATGKYYLQLS